MKKPLRFLSALLALTMAVSLTTTAVLAAGFKDTGKHWAKRYIDEGVKAGYLSGYSDGTFRPDAGVTRGAFCKILNQALGLEATAAISFSDVKSTDTFYTEIRKAVYAGYISGYDDGTFRAAKTITRQEAAVMLSRLITEPDALKNLDALKDASSVAAYAKGGVQRVMTKGYLAGDGNGRFNPDKPITRGQTAKVVSTLRTGERIVHGSVDYTTSGKTYSNNIYVGPLTVGIADGGSVTFRNCRLLGLLTVKSGAAVNLPDTDVTALSVTSTGSAPTVTVSGSGSVKHAYLSGAANLTESSLTGAGFGQVSFSGSALKTKTTALRGAFDSVTVSSPAAVSLSSGSIKGLNVAAGAAGSAFALAAGTNVASAVLNGACTFTGTGTITAAQQNVSGVTYQTAPGKITGTAASSSTLTPTVSPSDGTTGVSAGVSPTFTFGESIYDAGYSSDRTPSTTVLNNTFKLYRGSVTSSRLVDCTVSLSGKKVTLTPDASLTAGTTYYLVVNSGYLKNSSGTTNSQLKTSFTTASQATLSPTVSPADGKTGVAVTVAPTFTFSESVYDAGYSSNKTPSSTVLDKTFKLYRGSVTSSRLVDCTVSISGRVVTLTPDDNLSLNTTYYLVVNSGYLKNSSDDTNPYLKTSFTTSAKNTLTPSVSPSDGATGVSVGVSPTFTFSESIYDASYSSDKTPSSTVLDKTFKLYRSSVTSSRLVDCSVSLSGRVVTLTPDEDLNLNTTYYLVVNSGYLKNSSGTENSELQTSFTTSTKASLTPSVSPSDGATGVSVGVSPVFTFSEYIYDAGYSSNKTPSSTVLDKTFKLYRGSVTSSRLVDCTLSLSGKKVTLSPDSELQADTTYYLVVNSGYLKNSSGTENTYLKTSFTTATASAPTVRITSGTSAVDPGSTIRLQFSETVYRSSSGSALTDTYTAGKIALYQGSTLVSAGVTVSGTTVTITPSQKLASGKTYKVSVSGSAFYNRNGRTVAATDLSFTTAEEKVAATNITAANADFVSTVVQFDSTVTGTAKVQLKKSASELIEQTVTLVIGRNTTSAFTELQPGKTYDVTILLPLSDQTFKSFTGTVSTRTPIVTVDAEPHETSADVTVTCDYAKGTLTASYSGGDQTGGSLTLSETSSGTFSAPMTGLTPGGSYTVTVVLSYGDGQTVTSQKKFTTEGLSTNAVLSSLTVNGTTCSFNDQNAAERSLTLASGANVVIEAKTAYTEATVSINGDAPSVFSASKTISAVEGDTEVSVVVTAQDGRTTQTYTLTIHVTAPTPDPVVTPDPSPSTPA